MEVGDGDDSSNPIALPVLPPAVDDGLYREGLERQLTALKALRDHAIGNMQVCTECYTPRKDHPSIRSSDHDPMYWDIDQVILKVELELHPPAVS